MASVRLSIILLLSIFSSLTHALTTEAHNFQVTGKVSSNGTELELSTGAEGLEFTRSTQSFCDAEAPELCTTDVIESGHFSDEFLQSNQGAKYTFGLGRHQQSQEISVNGLPAMERHEAVYFKDRFWVYPRSGDIWSSSDGINWLKEAYHPELGRYSSEVVLFKGRLYLIGGNPAATNKDDVWVSDDGLNWELLLDDAPFGGRYGHAVTVFNDRLWLVAGESGRYPGEVTNDVWSSTDGENWVQETPNAGFSARLGHTLTVFNGKLVLVAGADSEHGGFSDVWSSTDGINWSQETPAAGFSNRSRHQTLVHDGRLWVIGGDEGYPVCDVWSSDNGVNWVRESEDNGTLSCARQKILQVQEGFYAIGGEDSERNTTDGVWLSFDLIDWTRLTRNDHFSPRYGHALVAFADSLWLIGGELNKTDEASAEVWSSTDGYHWQLEVESAPFGGRVNPDVVEFGGRLWLIGGGSGDIDIWSSADGVNWTQELETTPFVASHGVQATVHNNEIYVIGSHSPGGLDDPTVWSSPDGINWTQKNAAAPFGFRTGFGLISFAGKLFVIAGSFKNDIWSSTDGVEWTREAESASFDPRMYHQVSKWQGKLWLVAGQNQYWREKYVNDVWASDDGVTWASYTINSGFSIRGHHQLAVFNNRLWLVGGLGAAPRDDIWSSGDGTVWETEFTISPSVMIEYADVTSSADHGRVAPDSIQIATGSALDMSIFANDGYMVTSASGCGGTLVGSTFHIDDVETDCTVSADFEQYYFVFATSTSGGAITPKEVQRVPHGSTTSFEVTADEGYQISNIYGCEGALDGTTYTTSGITGDCYVAAFFERITYPVTLAAAEHGDIAPVDTLNPAHGDAIRLHIIADEGYEIASVEGCGGELAGPLYTTAAVTEACNVTASFRPQVFDISMNVSEGGKLTMAEGATREFGTQVVFAVAAKEGYELRSVSGCGGSLNGDGDYVISEMTGHCDINAYFGLRTYDITITVTSGGEVVYEETAPLTHGSQQEILLVPEEGFAVESASGCNGSLDGLVYTVAPESDCALDIVFRQVDSAPQNPEGDSAPQNPVENDGSSTAGGAISLLWLSFAALAFGLRRRHTSLSA